MCFFISLWRYAAALYYANDVIMTLNCLLSSMKNWLFWQQALVCLTLSSLQILIYIIFIKLLYLFIKPNVKNSRSLKCRYDVGCHNDVICLKKKVKYLQKKSTKVSCTKEVIKSFLYVLPNKIKQICDKISCHKHFETSEAGGASERTLFIDFDT